MQGFRALHSTACLCSVVLSGLFKLKVENLQRAVSFESWAVLPKAQGSLLVACCVRDCSGILCEHFRTTDNGQQTTVIFERGKISEQRYSGKPGGLPNALIKTTVDWLRTTDVFFELKVCGQCSAFCVQSSVFRVQSSEFRVRVISLCQKKKTPQVWRL